MSTSAPAPPRLLLLPLLLVAAALSCIPNPNFEAGDALPLDPFCGNGITDPDEECDQGPANADGAACTQSCEAAHCGDGLVHVGVEGCDDANTENGDGCSNHCQPLFYDNFADGLDPRWQQHDTPAWTWVPGDSGGFVEATLVEPQWTSLNLAFDLPTGGVVRFDSRILGAGVSLTLYVNGESLLSDDSSGSTSQHHEFPLMPGQYFFSWAASAMSGDGTVRLDNVYIGFQMQ